MIYDCLTEEEAKLFAHYKTSHDFCSNSRLGFVFDFYNELMETENTLPETPLQVGINLTDICNLKCRHCSRKNLLNSENSCFIKRWKEVIDELAFNGVFQIFLTGGEPLLHPEILEIIEYIKSKNIFVAILTNGILLTDKLVYKLDSLLVDEFDYIQISVDGIGSTYEDMRRGAKFTDIKERLELLKKHVVKTQVAMVVNEITYKEMLEVYQLCLKNDINSIRFMPMFDNDCLEVEKCDDTKIIKEFVKVLRDKQDFGRKIDIAGDPVSLVYPFAIWFRSQYPEVYFPTGKHVCPAGVTSCEISVHGEVYPCSYLENNIFFAGNIYEEKLKDLWKRQIWNCVRVRRPKSEKCMGCIEKDKCLGGCPASSFFRYKKFNYADGNCRI